MSSPIGTLMVEAEKKSKGKPNGHTSEAPCGCAVTVSRFGANSKRIDPQRCSEHAIIRVTPEPSKGRRRGSVVEV